MKIIRGGSTPTTLRGTCEDCGCIFECDTSECDKVYGNELRTTYEVTCPTAGCECKVRPTSDDVRGGFCGPNIAEFAKELDARLKHETR